MFKGLPGNKNINTFRFKFAPMVRIAQNEIDILARREIDTEDSAMVFSRKLNDMNRCSRNCPDQRS